jgi:hypothetical protein
MKPLCFVLMPFGQKPAADGTLIDFDKVYQELIAPALEAAEVQPFREDEQKTGGIIHKTMFESLALSEYAVADLTIANANVFYELGIRHAAKPYTTVPIYAKDSRLPFDVNLLRCLPYKIQSGSPVDLEETRKSLTALLREARQARTDSPIFQLLPGFPDTSKLQPEAFRTRVDELQVAKEDLARARKAGLEQLRKVEDRLTIPDADAAFVGELFLAYRDNKGWKDMVRLAGKMSPPLAQSVPVREQLALAKNRDGDGEGAERILLELIEGRGPSSETYGLLGRVYKDRWESALKASGPYVARGLLEKAIDAYLKGFEADWRDAYPGINALTLMELRQPPDPRRIALAPVVRYAVERRIAQGQPNYWDHATRLELAVLAGEEEAAIDSLVAALASVRAVWEPETTLRNIRLIREARDVRGGVKPWLITVESELGKAAGLRPKT